MLKYSRGHGKILEYVMIDHIHNSMGFPMKQHLPKYKKKIATLPTLVKEDFYKCATIFQHYFESNSYSPGELILNKDHMGKHGIVSDFDIMNDIPLTVSMKNNNMICKHNRPGGFANHFSNSSILEKYAKQHKDIVQYTLEDKQVFEICSHIADFIEHNISNTNKVKDLFYFESGIQASHIVKNTPSDVNIYTRYLTEQHIETVSISQPNKNQLHLLFNEQYEIKMSLYKNKSKFQFNVTFPSILDFYKVTSYEKKRTLLQTQ